MQPADEYSPTIDSEWNNPNKSEQIKEILKFRGQLLNLRMNYPLEHKIELAKRRIQTAVDSYGVNNCYVAFSGGKDSTVLSHITLSMGYKFEHVLSNTRLEYPECIRFSKEWCEKYGLKLTIITPKLYPVDIWKTYGYPMFSKGVSETLERLYRGYKCNQKQIHRVGHILRKLGYEGDLNNEVAIRDFLRSNEIKLSARCCEFLKKKPMQEWGKSSCKKVAILGTRASESRIRRTVWIRKGCIYETKGKVVVTPLTFFTDDDIWNYIKMYNIKVADIYYKGIKRNGCYCCGFGCHLRDENNFVQLKRLYPHLWKIVMEQWGFAEICKKCKIKFHQ